MTENRVLPDKKVKLHLVGLDGNAFALMAAFAGQARREGWSKEEVDSVLELCQQGDYNQLLCTLMEVCEDPDVEEDTEDDDDYEDYFDDEDEEDEDDEGDD